VRLELLLLVLPRLLEELRLEPVWLLPLVERPLLACIRPPLLLPVFLVGITQLLPKSPRRPGKRAKSSKLSDGAAERWPERVEPAGTSRHEREMPTQHDEKEFALTKVPAVTLGFWMIKILATTLGETGGDTVTMTWLGETTPEAIPGGYLIGTAIFGVLLILFVWAQIRAHKFNPWLYWATIVASTTLGTTLADFADRSLGIGYLGGSLLLLACVLGSLFAWHQTLGTVNVNTVVTPRQEIFYWITITFSQTLGTALGDWVADAGLGYEGGALLFGAGLAVLAILYFTNRANHVALFWAAFILTRPLGATVGDFLDKPVSHGGLEFSRPLASAVIAVAIVALILILPQRAGRHPGEAEVAA
jgi:uncharacterized membrane-anchored protein